MDHQIDDLVLTAILEVFQSPRPVIQGVSEIDLVGGEYLFKAAQKQNVEGGVEERQVKINDMVEHEVDAHSGHASASRHWSIS